MSVEYRTAQSSVTLKFPADSTCAVCCPYIFRHVSFSAAAIPVCTGKPHDVIAGRPAAVRCYATLCPRRSTEMPQFVKKSYACNLRKKIFKAEIFKN